MGDRRGRSISLESLPTGSVVYVGRDSFRMETVNLEDDDRLGIVQAMPVVTTAPYGIDARDEGRVIIELDRAVSSASWRAPALDSLFGSQTEVPRLAAPTGQASLAAPAALSLSRAAIAGMAALVFMGGLATASLTLQPREAAHAAAPAVIATPVAIPAEPEVARVPEATPDVEEPSEPATIHVDAPVKIRATKKARIVAASRAASASVSVEAAPAARWVDPFAD
jgi:hypothetical protein